VTEAKGRITINAERCKGCGLCISVCPNENIVLSKTANKKGIRVAEYNGSKTCTGCTFCGMICPDVSIEVYILKH